MKINQLYKENCLVTLSKMSDKFVDLVVTSPPYNMQTRIRNGKYTTKEKQAKSAKKYKHFGDDLTIEEFYLFHSEVLHELLRVSKIVCYNFQIVTGSKEAFLKMVGDFNKYIKDIIIWDKGHGQPSMHGKVLNSAYEMILILEDDKKCGRVIQNARFNRGEMSNILRLGRGKKVSNVNLAVFPETLPLELIKAFSEEGDLIYDPFMGIGTVAIVAKKLKRNWIGSEIVEEHCEIIESRI